MSKLELQIRHMHTGNTELAELESVDDAIAWLSERPQFVQVVRVRTAVPEAVEAKLRAAMRPLDHEERALLDQQDDDAEAARQEELRRLQSDAESDAQAVSLAAGGADREMELRWTRGEGLSIADPSDTREIPGPARRAALHWLRERDSWVHPRRQHVAAATLRVWPGSIPSGNEADRVIEGDFAPMAGLSDVEID